MQVHDLKKSNSSVDRKRVGRGGKRGKTSGKGMKGQNARQGNSKRPELRDIIKKLPKLRGAGNNGNRNKAIMKDYQAVNLTLLDARMDKGALVSPKTLLQAKLAQKQKGKLPEVKILGVGEITKPITVVDCLVSDTAREKIEAAGGTIK